MSADLAREVIEACRAAGLKLATAESCTGGLIAGALTDIPGCSDVVEGGVVSYSQAVKRKILGVSARTLAEYGVVSEEVAQEMAEGAWSHLGCDLAVATTGVAGPGPADGAPEGRVCFAVSGPVYTRTETVDFGAIGRDAVRRAAVVHGLEMLLASLRGLQP
ncbi:CinA family protein [Pseudooceanicola sp. 200-1SW]|uniref:CinA family protein n=1 Tax=Pseudooceanicola sp. 200-1SW TaxID=3425949 RepID=UPI003D7FFEB1